MAASLRVDETMAGAPLPIEEALAWGRSVADIVVLQVGGTQYSAGRIPELGVERWVHGTEVRERRTYEPPGPRASHFWLTVKATDGKPLDPGILDRLRADAGVREVLVRSQKLAEVSVQNTDEDVYDYVSDIVGHVPLRERTLDAPYSATRTISIIGPDRR